MTTSSDPATSPAVLTAHEWAISVTVAKGLRCDTLVPMAAWNKIGGNWQTLDGFLTAIAVGPETILPSEWLPVVWGGEEPRFEDQDQAQAVLGAIMDRYNEIVRGIDEKTVEPIFWYSEDTLVGADWAYGFARAILLREKQWEKMMASEASMMLFPIMLLHEGDGLFDEIGLEAGEERPSVEDAMGMLPASVLSIAEYWRMSPAERNELAAALDAFTTIEGNDPCPCGSGKKFKDCCGTLH